MFFKKNKLREDQSKKKQRYVPEETEMLLKPFIAQLISGTDDNSVRWSGSFIGVPQEFKSQFRGNEIVFTIQFCGDGPYAFLVLEGISVRMNHDEAVSLYFSIKEQDFRNTQSNLHKSLRKIMSSEDEHHDKDV